MNWKDAEKLCSQCKRVFSLKGVMSVEDAKRAVDIDARDRFQITEEDNLTDQDLHLTNLLKL